MLSVFAIRTLFFPDHMIMQRKLILWLKITIDLITVLIVNLSVDRKLGPYFY